MWGMSQEQKSPKFSSEEIRCPLLVSTQLGVSYSNEMGFASLRLTFYSHKILLTPDISFSLVFVVFLKNSEDYRVFPPLFEISFSSLLNSLIYCPYFSTNTRGCLSAFYSPNISSLKTPFQFSVWLIFSKIIMPILSRSLGLKKLFHSVCQICSSFFLNVLLWFISVQVSKNDLITVLMSSAKYFSGIK